MATAACLPIAADRAGACVRTIFFEGLDLTDVTLGMEVRLNPETPGAASIALGMGATANAEGLRLTGVTVKNGVPTSTVVLRINESTMKDAAKVPYSGELGSSSVMVYDLVGVFGQDKRRLCYGEIIALPTVFGMDAAPYDRSISHRSASSDAASWSAARLTFSDDRVTVRMDGADIIGMQVERAAEAADRIDKAIAALPPMTVETIPGVDWISIDTDEYGCILSILHANGRRENVATDVREAEIASASIAAHRTNVADADPAAETWEDEYGLVFARISKDGLFEIDRGVADEDAARLADIDRAMQARDGVTRTAAWTGIPFYGESTSVGSGSYPPISTVQPYANLTFTGGTKASVGAGTGATKPLVEDAKDAGGGADTTTHGETPTSAALNAVSAYAACVYGIDPAAMVLFGSTPGQGGMSVADLSKGGFYYGRFMGHVSAMRDLAAAAGKSFIVPCYPFICGANDAAAGTSRADYLARVKKLAVEADADIRAITGQALPVMMLIYQTSGTFAAGTIEPIQMAQIDAAEQSPLIELTAPWYDLTYPDGVHANAAGYNLAGQRLGPLIARYLFEGRTRALRLQSATARGRSVRLRFSENVALDFEALPAAPQGGVKIIDTQGDVPLTVSIEAGDVVCALGRALVGAWSARVALDFKGPGMTVGQGATGHSSNIRAALGHSYSSGGVQRTVYRWAPHCRVAGITLES